SDLRRRTRRSGCDPYPPPSVPRVQRSALFRRGVALEAYAEIHLGLLRYADRLAADGVQGDVPEPGAGHADARRELHESATVVGVPPAVAEAAKVGVVHEPNVARLGRLDDHQIVFVEVFAPVDEFHGLREGSYEGRAQ